MAAAVKCCIEAWPEARYIVKESVPGYEKGIRRGGWGEEGISGLWMQTSEGEMA